MSEPENADIHEYVRENKALLVQQLLQESPLLVLAKDDEERTPLHWACSVNNEEIAKMLLQALKKGYDLDDMVDSSGWTPLHISASVGNLELVKEMMGRDPRPDVDLKTNQGTTALHLAVSKNHYEVVRFLVVDCKCSCRIKDRNDYTPLHRAASIGSIPIIKILVEYGKININAKDRYGWTSLHHALSEGHGDAAVLLYNEGADPSIENSDGETPLQVAADDKVRSYFRQNISHE